MNSVNWSNEKRQLTRHFALQTLHEFNSGRIGVTEACQLLDLGKIRLYQLRTRWLQDREAFQIKTSGGDHRGSWPTPVIAFLREFVPLQTPCNFQLVADELLCLKPARSSVEAYIKTHLPTLIPSPAKKPRAYRRFRRARFGELFQHDSSIHQWWPGPEKQILLLTLDDHSGLNIAGRFVPCDTTWPLSPLPLSGNFWHNFNLSKLRRNDTVFIPASVPDYRSPLAFGDKPKVPQAWVFGSSVSSHYYA